MHCFVMGFLNQPAILVISFHALHKISRMKASSELISASLKGECPVCLACASYAGVHSEREYREAAL